jgi:hypothetical protein
MVATPLPANSAAAKSEIIVARASGTTSVAQVWRVECMNAKPPPTNTDKDQRARPKSISDELDGPGPAEHRKPVEPDCEPGNRGAEAGALERRSEEGEEAQYHRPFDQHNPYHR